MHGSQPATGNEGSSSPHGLKILHPSDAAGCGSRAAGVLTLAQPAPALAQGEGVHVAPPTTSFPSAKLPGWNAVLGDSFNFNAGEGGGNSNAARPSGLPFIDGHTRQAGENFRVNAGDRGG